MISTKTSIALRASSAACALGLALLSTPSFAQDTSAQPNATATGTAPQASANDTVDDKTIIVTGSIVRNPAAATASPVTILTADTLLKRGFSSTSDALQNLAANNAGTNPPSWSSWGFATGASSISLRGLNDAYTLTLFNGMRSAFYPLGDDGYRSFVDTNSIPTSLIERIDILQDGASATYGSDAIAGVVNIIIKKQIQGLHLDVSGGIAQRGDAGEQKVSAQYGYGDLVEQGFNVYADFEYQHNAEVPLRDLGAPFGTANQSTICSSIAGIGCLTNSIRNGIQADGSYNGFQSTIVGFARPVDPATGQPVKGSQYALLSPSLGCQGLKAQTLTADQQTGNTPANGVVCQQDRTADYQLYNSDIKRIGGNLRATARIGDNAEAYVMFNFADVKTAGQVTNLGFANQTAAGGVLTTVNQIYLPVYVCAQGVGSVDASGNLTATGCNASNGTLNPNNPYAAQGKQAQLLEAYNVPRITDTDAKTYRVSGGIDGTIGGDFLHYNVGATASWVTLDVTNNGYQTVSGIEQAVAQGTYNFADQSANSAAANQIVAPTNYNHSISKLTQIQAEIDKDLFTLPGGKVNVAITGQYRYEAIHNPSANPPDNDDPDSRYYSINAVGVDGTRHVWSAGYEVSVPVFEQLNLKASGSYDSYSTGQSHFSPKFEATFKPIQQVKFRGTYSKGFRIPSFAESFAQPTTGYVNAQINCAVLVAFCQAHPNTAYYASGYTYGLTSSGNPDLAPEKSTSYTIGVVLQPTRNITLTVDYWHTKINATIIPVQVTDEIINDYYNNNGVVNIPGITVTKGVADQDALDALPLLGTVSGSYNNAGAYVARGIDFAADASFPLGDKGIVWQSHASASYLMRLAQTLADGTVQRYDGTLGPCNITSCSGAPKWRINWQNTIDFNKKGSLTLTAYWTEGYSEVAADTAGGVYGDCEASANGGQVFSYNNPDANGNAVPVQCRAKAVFDLDGHGEVKVEEKFTLYADVLNILNKRPAYEPNAAYGLYNFNPAWSDRLAIGRYFRIGARVDF